MLCDLKIIVLNNYGMYFTKNKMQYINFVFFLWTTHIFQKTKNKKYLTRFLI